MIIDTLLSSNEHIVRTTQQWEAAAVKYKIIPNGCLCVEFTPDGKTKIKVGDGHKYYAQLPYIGGDIDIHEIIELIEEYVDSKEFMEIQEPVVPSVDDLPSTGNDIGDVRFVINDNPTGEHDLYIPYVWFNDKWNIVGGGNVDLSNYPTKEEMNEAIDVVDDKVDTLSETVNTFDDRITNAENKVSELDEKVTEIGETVETFDERITNVENKAHTHSNKTILDNTTASFTTQEKTKLAGIEDHANNYSLPAATTTDLGGVIVGDNLSITEQGVLSATAQQIDVDDHFDDESTNPVQNRVLTPVLEALSREITPSDVDLWWGMQEAKQLVMGNAIIYLDGAILDTPSLGPIETITE